jgi:replicative DNA helicase
MNASAKLPDVNDLHRSGVLPSDPFANMAQIVPDEDDTPVPPPEDDAPIDYDQLPEVASCTEQTAKEREQIVDNKAALTDAAMFAYERASRGSDIAGMSTGFRKLDKILDGLRQGCLYGLGGRPGMGKSMLALNICLNAAKHGHGVYYVSLEMATREHALRQLFCLGGVPSYRWKNNTMRPEDWSRMTSAVGEASKYPILWDDVTGQTIEKIRKRTEAAQDRFAEDGRKLGLLIIDHALLVRGSVRGDRRQQLIHITNQMKCIAKELSIAVLALAQLSRAVESRAVKCKKPQMSDFKESGSWEEDGDGMLLLFREDYYTKDRAKWNNELEVDVVKVRDGVPGMVKLRFDGACQRVLPLETDDAPEGTDSQEHWSNS